MSSRFDRFRKISHSLNFSSLYDGEKECWGYTLFSHLITMGKKSVGCTVSPHLYGGEKECGGTLFPKKMRACTDFFSSYSIRYYFIQYQVLL